MAGSAAGVDRPSHSACRIPPYPRWPRPGAHAAALRRCHRTRIRRRVRRFAPLIARHPTSGLSRILASCPLLRVQLSYVSLDSAALTASACVPFAGSPMALRLSLSESGTESPFLCGTHGPRRRPGPAHSEFPAAK